MANKETIELYDGEEVIYFYPKSHRYRKKGQKTYLISNTSVTGVVSPYGKTQGLMQWATNLACDHALEYLEEFADKDMVSAEEMVGVIEDGRYKHKEEKEEAGDIGDEVHAFAEEFARRKVAGEELTDEMLEFEFEETETVVHGFLDWVESHDIEFLVAEKVAYSRKDEYIGTFDALAVVDGKLTLIDYKTSKRVYLGHKLQTAGYWNSVTEEYEYLHEQGHEIPGTIEQAMVVRFDKGKDSDDNLIPFSAENNIWTLDHEDYPLYRDTFLHFKRGKAGLKEINALER